MILDYSQYGQVEVLERLLPPGTPRSLVDAGAYDGLTNSNSRALLEQGWSGLLIEPLPEAFRRLKANCRGLDSARCIYAACADRSSRGRLWIGADGAAGQNSSLAGGPGGFVEVDVLGLSDLLSGEGWPARFGVLLIDTEGMDLEVLEGLDPARHRPVAVVTEEFPDSPRKQRRKYDLLFRRGYEFCGVMGSDSIWVLKGSARPLPADGCPVLDWRPLTVHEGIAGGYVDEPHSSKFGDPPPLLRRPASGLLPLRGWAIDRKRGTVPPDIALRMTCERTGDVAYYPAYRTPRPDVADALNRSAYFLSGFRGAVPLSGRGGGTWRIELLQAKGGRVLASGPVLRLEVLPESPGVTLEETAARFLNGAGLTIGAGLPRLPAYCRATAVGGGDAEIDTADLENVAASTQDFVLAAADAVAAGHALRVLKPGGTFFAVGSLAGAAGFDTLASVADPPAVVLRKPQR